MTKRPSVNTFGSGFASGPKLDENFENVRASFLNTLSIDGSTPNAMEADLDMNSNDIINVANLSATTLFIGGNAITVGSATESTRILIRQEFNSVATLLSNTGSFSTGEFLRVNNISGVYEVADSGATDHHLTTSGGVKLYYRPVFGVNPKAVGATTGIVTDNGAKIQLAIDVAVDTGSFLDLAGESWRSDITLSRNGLTNIFAADAYLYFPTSGTYDLFKLNDGTTDASIPTKIAFDVSGEKFTVLGNLFIESAVLSNAQASSRALIDIDLACFGGKTGYCAEFASLGQIVIQGFAYPFYIPETDTNLGSRQFARLIGTFRTRFCLTSLGYWGSGANAFDDSKVNIRTDRCGGFNDGTTDLKASVLRKSTMNMGYFFGSGLNDLGAQTDAEPSTISVNGTTTLTLSASHPYLRAGDSITVNNAFARASDGVVRPLVCLVTNVSGTTVTVDALTTPTETASGLSWYYKPQIVDMSNCHWSCDHMYLENYWDMIQVQDRSAITAINYKHGGVKLSGRQGAVINTTGLDSMFRLGVEPTAMESTQVDSIINFGMIRRTSDNVDSGIYARLEFRVGTDTTAYGVVPVTGIDPVEFFASGRTSRFGFNLFEVNIVYEYPDKMVRSYVESTGVVTVRTTEDGVAIRGTETYATQTQVGSLLKNVDITNVAATIYTASDLSTNSVYEIWMADGNRTFSEQGLFFTDGSGNVTVSSAAGANITLSGSTTNLQAVRTSGSSPITVGFVIVRRL